MSESLVERLRSRLLLPLPGREAQERMVSRVRPMPDEIPATARDSAVLQLIYPVDNDIRILFIRRTEDGRAHSGQISFPGGRHEPEDASLMITALREAEEEVGIVGSEVEVLGALTPMYIPVSFFMVHPFLAWSPKRPEFLPSKNEVSELIEVSISDLFNPSNKVTRDVWPSSVPGLKLSVPVYLLQDDTFIWGATAMMLSELEDIWNSLSPGR
jgi:8-oxo-dGTP pyrophosphatase MutT (NUDIX family)